MKMNFDKEIFPAEITKLLTCYFEYSTIVITCNNGQEAREANITMPIKKYHLKNITVSTERFSLIHNFFLARMGRLNAFTLLDPYDHKAEKQNISISTGNMDNVRLVKRYSTAGDRKRIFAPVDGSIRLYSNKDELQYKINEDAVISFQYKKGEHIYADFKFYTIVRFANDNLSYKYQSPKRVLINNLELIEVIL